MARQTPARRFVSESAAPARPTGEPTPTGQVLPVGGIREHILLDANRRDFDKLPEHIRAGMTVHFAKRYKDVATVVFG
jgi:ATP-dependent Lon protease